MANQPDQRRTDPLLLVEVVLALALFGLMVGLYWIPSMRPPFLPARGTGLLLALLFFVVVGLDAWRRRRRAGSGSRAPFRDEIDGGRH